MDLNGINQGGTPLPLPTPADRDAAPLPPKSEVVAEPVQVPAVKQTDPKQTEERRLTQVRTAADRIIRDVFVVSDTRFTIFKDSSGQYITRFTNLRDGSVTYIPEPEILRYLESVSAQRQALVEIDA